MNEFTKYGIDKIDFYTSHYYLDLRTLAKERGFAADKFATELGQNYMAISPPGADIVTLAANAAAVILQGEDANDIGTVLFATESGVDFSKAAGMYIHQLLHLSPHCRVVELKQACYAGTAGLQLGLAMLRCNPEKKVLLLVADIAHYGMETSAESSQGAGAVAMLLTANPRLLVINPESGVYAQDSMDFWRPNYADVPFVQGKASCDLYLKALEESWRQYQELSGRDFMAHERFCYHVPVPRLVETAHKKLARINGYKTLTADQLVQQMEDALFYNREIGNCYTASLYLSIISLLDRVQDDLSNKLLGLYSYGSGCVGEYFSAQVVPGYQKLLTPVEHVTFLQQRTELSYAEYQEFYAFKLPQDGSAFTVPEFATGKFKLQGISEHKRIYVAL